MIAEISVGVGCELAHAAVSVSSNAFFRKTSLVYDLQWRSKVKRIYLDTNLWNLLCDQSVAASKLLASLYSKHCSLVLSYQVVFELAKCFPGLRKGVPERGAALFAYMREFVHRNIPCVTELLEVLSEEMWALKLDRPVNPFLPPEGYTALGSNVDLLAGGKFDERAAAFVEERTALALRTRVGPIVQLGLRPDVKQRLSDIPDSEVGEWLRSETFTDRGASLLAGHVRRQFCEASPEDAREWALGLLASPICRLSRALVRADLYYNWRCAKRGSNPSDLFDDMYHVLNAVYCDVYATRERRHAQYAGLLLAGDTRVAIYEAGTPVGDWIVSLA
jgi:hypothetical protein